MGWHSSYRGSQVWVQRLGPPLSRMVAMLPSLPNVYIAPCCREVTRSDSLSNGGWAEAMLSNPTGRAFQPHSPAPNRYRTPQHNCIRFDHLIMTSLDRVKLLRFLSNTISLLPERTRFRPQIFELVFPKTRYSNHSFEIPFNY